MMARIGKFSKEAADRKRYVVDYADWLNEEEMILAVQVSGSIEFDAFYVDGFVVSEDGKEVIFYASGGVPLNAYTLTVTVTTSMDQIKEDEIVVIVT